MKRTQNQVFIGIIFFLTLGTDGTQSNAFLKRDLMLNIFETYNKDARPSKTIDDPVHLTFGFNVMEVIDLDEKKQTFRVSLKIRQVWTNYFLHWDPAEYGGITHIVVSPKKVWLPDIVLYNNVHKDNTKSDIGRSSSSLVLYYNGTVVWSFPVIVKTKCQVDIAYFPFDEQICTLKFGSWTYDADKVNLTAEADHADLSQYTPNSIWALVSVHASLSQDYYQCCPDLSYIYITYRVILRRRSLFFLINLILPIMLVVALSIITFIIPIKCGERMKVAFALLLSMFEFMRIIEDIIPSSSDVVPLISYLFGIILLEMTVVVVVNCLIFQISFPPYRAMPAWLRDFLERRHQARLVKKKDDKEDVRNKETKDVKDCISPSFNSSIRLPEGSFSNGYKNRPNRFIPCSSRECRCYGRSYNCMKMASSSKDKDMETNMLVQLNDNKEKANVWNTLAYILNKIFSWFLGSIIFGTSLAVFLLAWPRYTT